MITKQLRGIVRSRSLKAKKKVKKHIPGDDKKLPLPHLGLYILADGMTSGGFGYHAAGKAVGYLGEECSVLAKALRDKEDGEPILDPEALLGFVRNAFLAVNQDISDMAYNRELKFMGTTLDICMTFENKAYFAHVGDSRIYHFSAEGLDQLTVDNIPTPPGLNEEERGYHALVEHRLTEYLGTGSGELHIQTGVIDIGPGDLIFMATDGVTNNIHKAELEEICALNDVNLMKKRIIKLVKEPGLMASWLHENKYPENSLREVQEKMGRRDDATFMLIQMIEGKKYG